MTATTLTALAAAAMLIPAAASAQATPAITAAYSRSTDTYCVVRNTSSPDAIMWSHANKGRCLTRSGWQARGVVFDAVAPVTQAANRPAEALRAG